MVARNRVSDQFGHRLVARVFRKRKDQRRACDGMLDTSSVAFQPPLKLRIILAKVVQQPRDPGRPLASAGTGEQRGEFGHFRQMLRKRLPIALAGFF